MSPNLLTLTFLIPLAGSLVCLLVPKEAAAKGCRWVNLVSCIGAFVATLLVWQGYAAGTGTVGAYRLVEDAAWIPFFKIRYHLGVDGVSVALLLLTSFVSLTASLASWK